MKEIKNELLTLKNVGPATYEDLYELGIHSIRELANADPDELYLRLQKITNRKHDPCVWDVFAAIIHEAKTGIKQPWWEWTKVRKKRQGNGTFLLHSAEFCNQAPKSQNFSTVLHHRRPQQARLKNLH